MEPAIEKTENSEGTMSSLKDYVDIYTKVYSQTKNELYYNIKKEYGISEKSANYISEMDDSVIEGINYNNIEKYFEMIGIDNALFNRMRSRNAYLDLSYIDYTKHVFSDVKDRISDLNKETFNIEEINKNIDAIRQQYIDYSHSDEFLAKKNEKINALKMKASVMPDDDPKKKEILEKLEITKSLDTMDFLFKRIESYGTDELGSIMKSFFNVGASSNVMSKFKSTCKKINVKPAIIQYFFNFEDRYLSEEYAPFNNLFLFICVRFISYIDTTKESERFYATKIIGTLVKFVDHKLYENEEKHFIQLIERLDSYFIPYVEIFKEKNTTYKNNKEGIAKVEKLREKKRQDLLTKVRLRGIDVVDNLSIESLTEILKEYDEKVAYRNELEEKCKKYGIEFNKGEALANLEIFVKAAEEEYNKKENEPSEDSTSDQVIDEDSEESSDAEYIDVNIDSLGLTYEIIDDDNDNDTENSLEDLVEGPLDNQ